MRRRRDPASWPAVLAYAFAIALIAAGTNSTFPNEAVDEIMTGLYVAAAVALLVWRMSMARCALVAFGMALFSASLFRTVVFTELYVNHGQRLSGIGFNVFLMTFTWRFFATQEHL